MLSYPGVSICVVTGPLDQLCCHKWSYRTTYLQTAKIMLLANNKLAMQGEGRANWNGQNAGLT